MDITYRSRIREWETPSRFLISGCIWYTYTCMRGHICAPKTPWTTKNKGFSAIFLQNFRESCPGPFLPLCAYGTHNPFLHETPGPTTPSFTRLLDPQPLPSRDSWAHNPFLHETPGPTTPSFMRLLGPQPLPLQDSWARPWLILWE